MFKKNSQDEKDNPFIPNAKFQKLQFLAVLALVALIAGVTSFHKIDTSEQGVVTRFGRFTTILEEGPHFVLPFGIDRVYAVPVTKIHELEFGFRKNQRGISSDVARQESLMLTGDLNIATVQWILQYKVINAKKFIFHVRTDQVRNHIRDTSISVMRTLLATGIGRILTSAVHLGRSMTALNCSTWTEMGILISSHAKNVISSESSGMKIRPYQIFDGSISILDNPSRQRF